MPSGNIAILTLTVTAAGALAANRFVNQAGAYPAAAAKGFGVTRSSAVAGDLVPCDVHGTTVVEAGATVTRDQSLQLDATGRVIPLAAGAAVGRAMEDGTAGGFIEILLTPAG